MKVSVIKLLLLCLGLAACGTPDIGGPSPAKVLSQTLQQRIKSIGAPAPQPIQITRAHFANVPGHILLVNIPSRDAVASLVLARESRGSRIWMTADGISLTTQGGLLSATRGLGHDIMSSDLAPLAQALKAGHGSYTRTQWTLNGEDQMEMQMLNCQLHDDGAERIVVLEHPKSTRHYRETCVIGEQVSGDQIITNHYWRGQDGTLWKSQIWLNPQLETITIEVVQ